MPTFRVFPGTDSGGSAGWQATGSQFWAQLDEDPNDGDTTYIQAGGDSVPSRTFRFLLQKVGIPDGTLVSSVSLVATGERVDVGQNVEFDSFKLRTYLLIGPSSYLVATQQIEDPGAYVAISYFSTTSPATGLAWTAAEVQRLSPILEVTQIFNDFPRVGAFGRFTQLYADISFISPTWTIRDLSAQGNR